VIKDKALAQLKTAKAAGKPFFLEVAPIAPHDSVITNLNPAQIELALSLRGSGRGLGNMMRNLVNTKTIPPVPAPRHAGLFKDVQLPIKVVGGGLGRG